MTSSRLTKRVRTPPLQRNARKIEHRYPTTTSVAARIGDGAGSSALLDLPDELLLLIISQLHALRLDKTQSEAFRNKQKETHRQYENHHRRIALHSLCFASKRLNRLAVPVLYSAFTGSTTRYGLTPLRLFWNTLSAKTELRLHLNYVENVLSDYLGNNLVDDLEGSHSEDIVDWYFPKLANLICIAPNIEQMSIVSLENFYTSLWKHIYGRHSKRDNETIPPSSYHSLLKLKKLSIQTNGGGGRGGEFHSLDKILCRFSECSLLTEIHILGASDYFTTATINYPSFKQLQRLVIAEVSLFLHCLDAVLSKCEGLRHLVCHWYFLECSAEFQKKGLLPNLLKHSNTLETLWLVANRAGIDEPVHEAQLGLCQMPVLKEVSLCNLFIPDEHNRYPHPSDEPAVIAQDLPPYVEHLTISYTLNRLRFGEWSGYVKRSLLRLAEDCPRLLPRLKVVVVQFEGIGIETWERAKLLMVSAFAVRGVQLTIVEQLDFVALIE